MKLAISHVMNTHNTALCSELHKKLVTAMNEIQSQSSSSNLPDVAASSGSGAPGAASGANAAAGSGNEAAKEMASPVGNAASVREWIDIRNKKAALKLEKLDTDLKNYKSNSIKV